MENIRHWTEEGIGAAWDLHRAQVRTLGRRAADKAYPLVGAGYVLCSGADPGVL